MKSLNHLPDSKKNELSRIVRIIQESCDDVGKIILFGSYARGNYKEKKDVKPSSKSGHVSDYDILVITEKKDAALDSILWSRISETLQDLHFSAHPKIITHDITELNRKLSEGQYFFSDVAKEGIELFCNKKFELAQEKKLTSKEQQKIAQEHFYYWHQRAKNFSRTFRTMLLAKQFTDAAFHSHQIAESCYKGILLVFTNYTPREHFLEILGREAEKHCFKLKNIFPKLTKKDEERFKLLEYAYIGGRYDPTYRISKEDLDILTKDVKRLLKITKEVCEERINSLGSY